MNLRCYRCMTWQEAHPRYVPPVGVDVWCCRVCKADQFARDGAPDWLRKKLLRMLLQSRGGAVWVQQR